jgi:hypothetical protein
MVAAILFLPSESRTNIVGSDKKVRLSNGKNKMADHLKAGLSCPAFKWSTSLDRFGMNKIVFMTLFYNKTV